MKRTLVTLLAIVTISCSDETPTSPSTGGASAGPRQTLLPEMVAPLTGGVFSTTGVPIAGATVLVLDGLSSGTTVTSDANGRYRFERLPRANTNLSATAVNYIEDRRGVHINGSDITQFRARSDTALHPQRHRKRRVHSAGNRHAHAHQRPLERQRVAHVLPCAWPAASS